MKRSDYINTRRLADNRVVCEQRSISMDRKLPTKRKNTTMKSLVHIATNNRPKSLSDLLGF